MNRKAPKNQGSTEMLNGASEGCSDRSSSEQEVERPHQTIGGRIRYLRRGALNLSVRAMAAQSGVSEATIKRSEAGTTKPPAILVDYLVQAAGARREWIECEEGTPFLGEAPDDFGRLVSARIARAESLDARRGDGRVTAPPYDRELLKAVVLGIEDYLLREDIVATPEQRAKLVVLMYDLFLAKGGLDREELYSLLRIAA